MQLITLSVKKEDQILYVTLQRPKELNAINALMMGELREVMENYHRVWPGTKGIIITGSGEKAFAAGADIREFVGLTPAEASQLSRNGHITFNLIENAHVPVIAAVNGFALGGGCELAMACHIRIAAANAKFGQPEANLGLIPGFAGTQRLPQLVGKGKALELLMTGDMIDAEEAFRIGLANEVVSTGTALEEATKMMKKILKKGPLAIKYSIRCVNANFNPKEDGAEIEIAHFGQLMASDEGVEGISAFIEKRKPDFNKV